MSLLEAYWVSIFIHLFLSPAPFDNNIVNDSKMKSKKMQVSVWLLTFAACNQNQNKTKTAVKHRWKLQNNV